MQRALSGQGFNEVYPKALANNLGGTEPYYNGAHTISVRPDGQVGITRNLPTGQGFAEPETSPATNVVYGGVR